MNKDTNPGTTNVERTTVLLAAGASKNAGLPLTNELARQVVEKANSNLNFPLPNYARVLNVVHGALGGYQGLRGENPLRAVNIERLISAIRLLQDRDNHEVAPFVASWSSGLSEFGADAFDYQRGKRLVEAIDRALVKNTISDKKRLTEVVAETAIAAVRPDLRPALEGAERFVLKTLLEILGNDKDVSYFEPLIKLANEQPGGVDVITLNYDLTVEHAAEEAGAKFWRGVEEWEPGQELSFPLEDGTINLLKLHGSLDWKAVYETGNKYSLTRPMNIEVLSSQPNPQDSGFIPWIVVGDRDKLGTEGPTLELNSAARSVLGRTTHLAIVGYSFGDTHINNLIRNWLANDVTRTATVVDPTWDTFHRMPNGAGFKSDLIGRYAKRRDANNDSVVPRVLPIKGTAASHLQAAIDERPSKDPKYLMTFAVERGATTIRLDVTWHGPGLDRVRIHVMPTMTDDEAARVNLSSPQAMREHEMLEYLPLDNISFKAWEPEETKTLILENTGGHLLDMTIIGGSILGGYRHTASAADIESGRA